MAEGTLGLGRGTGITGGGHWAGGHPGGRKGKGRVGHREARGTPGAARAARAQWDTGVTGDGAGHGESEMQAGVQCPWDEGDSGG